MMGRADWRLGGRRRTVRTAAARDGCKSDDGGVQTGGIHGRRRRTVRAMDRDGCETMMEACGLEVGRW